MTASCLHDYELDYRCLDLRVDSISNRTIRGVVVPYERWQRVPDDDSMRARKRRPRKGRIAPPGAGRFREKVRRGAIKMPTSDELFGDTFSQALEEQGIHDVRALINHNPNSVVGQLSDRSLRLKNVGDNLNFELDLPENSVGNKVIDKLNDSEDKRLGMSVGFKRYGRKSNVIRKNYDQDLPDSVIEKDFTFSPDETRAIETVETASIQTPNLQTGLLDGSDYVEGVHVPTGRQWRVYFQLDLREVSILVDTQPAWQGTFAELGTGNPTNLTGVRDRQIIMAGLGIV